MITDFTVIADDSPLFNNGNTCRGFTNVQENAVGGPGEAYRPGGGSGWP
jgi:hypothetical protein